MKATRKPKIMDVRCAISRILAGFAVAIFGCALPGAAAPGYLARIGPSPLRFQAAAPTKLIALPPLPAPLLAPPEPATEELVPPPEPNEPAIRPPDPAPIPSPILEAPDQSSNVETLLPSPVGQTAKSGASAPAANDLLTVHPQMMIEYFRPIAGSTNGVGVSAYVPIPFNPATPATVPPSRATYKTQ